MGFEPFDPFGEKDKKPNENLQENESDHEDEIVEENSSDIVPSELDDVWDSPIVSDEIYEEGVEEDQNEIHSMNDEKQEISSTYTKPDSDQTNHLEQQKNEKANISTEQTTSNTDKVAPTTPEQVPINVIPATTMQPNLNTGNGIQGDPVVKQKGRGGIYALLIVILIISLLTFAAVGIGVYAVLSVTSGYSDDYYSGYESDTVKIPEVKPVPKEGRIVPEFGQAVGAYIVDDNIEPTVAIKEAVGPAVVGIVDKIARKDSDEFRSGAGSGIVLSSDGYIITNYHVISNADKLYVVFEGETDEVPADLIGYDDIRDIAVIKVARNNLTAPIFGDSSKIQTGEMSVAIGNPLGTLNGTITQGIISASNRELTLETGRTQDFIQTDTAINPGNSGGALLNRKGEVIGINTRKETTIAIDDWGMPIAAEGIGYAIPINDALFIAEVLIREGKIERAQLGVTLKFVTADMEEAQNGRSGVAVASVTKGGPADLAGIRKGDIITEIDDTKIEAMSDISNLLEKKNIGEDVNVKVVRDGKEFKYVVTLQNVSS